MSDMDLSVELNGSARPGPSVTAPAASTANFRAIDHIAIAVIDLEQGIEFFTGVLGFDLVRRLEVKGKRTGMLSAELEKGGIKFVLCQGTERESQVSRLIEHYGAGVAHIALAVDSVEHAAEVLGGRGLPFDTSVIRGAGLKQVFSSRDPNTGISFEFIERNGEAGFLEENVHELFAQLEKSGAY
jgi:4-hydroxyphenylpyruvate dioxygenase-like putative hemolysin